MKTLHIAIIGITLTLLLSSSVPVHARTGIIEIKTDKLVYANSDRPVITISASPYSKVELEIDDPYGNAKLFRLLDMPKDGIAIYTLDISWYKPGIYSATVNMTSSKATTSFAVGLMSPGGDIDFSLVKKSYIPGDNIIILGTTNPNIILDLSLIDPNGTQIKKILTYSDKDGHFSSFDFRIPPNATSGIWKIEATRGVIHHYVEINVNFLTSTNVIQNDTNAGIPTDRFVMGTIHIESPLKQFKSGIKADDIKCEQGLQLVIKAEDNSPACVTQKTAQKLVEIGWGWAMQSIDSLKSLMPNRIIGLENDTGIVTLQNQTYYFETPNYTDTAFSNPVQISFHNVVFTLFPSGFKGGLPTDFGGVATNGCSGSYFWTDAKFSGGIHELLHIFAITTMSQHCQVLPAPTDFSTHINPQAGLTFYDGKMKLLVGTKNTLESSTRLHPIDIVSIQFLPTTPNPGGPTMQMTLTNIGMTPVTHLNATLVLNNNYVFNFKDVTESNPLAPSHSTSDTEMLIGVGSTEMTYPLTVIGTENNKTFSYTLDIHIPYTNENEIIKVRR